MWLTKKRPIHAEEEEMEKEADKERGVDAEEEEGAEVVAGEEEGADKAGECERQGGRRKR